MKKITLLITFAYLIGATSFKSFSTDYSQVSSTCIDTLEILNEYIGAQLLSTGDNYTFTIEIPHADSVALEVTNISDFHSNDKITVYDGEFGGDVLYTEDDGVKNFSSNSNKVTVYYQNVQNGGGESDFSMIWKGILRLNIASSDVTCKSGSDGEIAVSTSGYSPITYAWSGTNSINGQSSQTGLVNETYYVTVTDNQGCDIEKSIDISEPELVAVTVNNSTNTLCYGTTNGVIELNTPTGGSETGYTYSWTTSDGSGLVATDKDQSGLGAGTYTVVVRDDNLCESTPLDVTISSSTEIQVSASSTTNILCNGASTGAITLNTATGGSGTGYSYNWTSSDGSGHSATGLTQSGLSAGTYTVIASDDNSCESAPVDITLTENSKVAVTLNSQTNVNCNGALTGAITMNAPTGGSGPTYSYTWTSTDGSGYSGSTLNQTNISAGTYTLVVEDGSSCASDPVDVTITENAPVVVTENSKTNILCNGGSTGKIIINTPTGGSGTGYSYSWTTSDGSGLVATDQNQFDLTVGTYSIVARDGNSCASAQLDIELTQNSKVTVSSSSTTNILCNGASTGAITLNTATGGSGSGYSYNWTSSDGSGHSATGLTQSGLSAGTYTVVASDDNSCESDPVDITLTENSKVTVSLNSQTNVNCNGASTGAITMNTPTGGSGPTYSYTWTSTDGSGYSGSTLNQTNISAGTYTLVVEDGSSCASDPVNVTITENAPVVVTENSKTNILCNGGSTGKIIINTPTGGSGTGYSYSWTTSDGSGLVTTDQNQFDLTVGTYSVVARDGNSCASAQLDIELTQNSKVAVSSSSTTNILCNGASTGAITLNIATGGSGSGYSYNWTSSDGSGHSATGLTQSGLSAGTYTVVASDDNSCESDPVDITLIENSKVAVTLNSQTNVNCNGALTGAITMNTPTGGSGPTYSYTWTSTDGSGYSSSTLNQTNISAGTYTIVVEDGSSCASDPVEVTITEKDPIAVSLSLSGNKHTINCVGDNDGTIEIDATGGNSLNFTWSTTDGSGHALNDEDQSGLSPGTYNVVVGDDQSCPTDNLSVTINQRTPANVQITNLASQYCNNGDTVLLIGIPTDVNGVFSGPGIVPFSNNNGTALFSPKIDTSLNPNPISITYSYDDNGCPLTDVETTIIRPLPDPEFTIPDKVSSSKTEEIITGIATSGGTFSGPGVLSVEQKIIVEHLTLDVAEKIFHEVSNNYGCTDTLTKFITKIQEGNIIESGNPSNTNLYFCYDQGEIVFEAQFAQTLDEGWFLNTGVVIDDNNESTGRVNPAGLNGTYDLEFHYKTGGIGGVTDTIRTKFTVFNVSSQAQIDDLEAQYCRTSEPSQEIRIHAITQSAGSGYFTGPTGLDNQGWADSAIIDINAMSVTNGTPHYINYIYTHSESGCSYTRTQSLNIYDQPTVSFNIKDTFNVEENPKPFENLVPSSGGTFTGTGGVVGQTFNPQGLDLGDYTITYKYTNPTTQCSNEYEKKVTVETAKGEFVGLPANNIYCANGADSKIYYKPKGNSHTPVDFTLITPIDTVVMSTGSDTMYIIPDTLKGGSYTINYTYLNIDGVTTFTLSKGFAIDDIGTPSVDVPKEDFCNYDSEVTLYGTINNNIAGRGIFSGEGLILDLTNDGEATFVPQSAKIGASQIVYTYNSTYPNSTCVVYDTILLNVHDLPQLSYNLLEIYNIEGDNDTIIPSPSGGTFSPSDYFAKDYIFDPSLVGNNTKEITYNYTDEFGCFNSLTKQLNLEQVTGNISNLKTHYCYDEGIDTLVYTGIENPISAVGKFSGLGITDLGNNKAIFNPDSAFILDTNIVDSMATISITFEYLGSDNTTMFTKVLKTKVRNNGSISIKNLNDTTGYCANATSVSLSATPIGGSFSGNGITNMSFIPNTVNDTITYITYTYSHGESGCSISKTDTIPILEVPTLIFDVPARVCSNAEVDTLIGYPRGGEITSQLSIAQLGGFADSVKFTPNPDFVGSRNITYTYTNPANNCTESIKKSIITDTIPDVSIDFTMPEEGFCYVNTELTIEGEVNKVNVNSGYFRGKGIKDSIRNDGENIYNPLTAGVGDDLITYTYTDANGCTNTAEFESVVNALPNLSINGGALKDTAFCGNHTGSITLNGIYQSGSDVRFVIENQTFYKAQHDFYPASYGNRDSVVIEFHNTDNNNCYNSVTETVKILDVPDRTFSMSSICIAQPIQFTYEGSSVMSGLDSVKWDFGDDNISYDLNPSHNYEAAEELEVHFYIWAKNGCKADTLTPPLSLETSPNAFFDWMHECYEDTVVFTSEGIETSYVHEWDFGDGTTSSETNPTKTFDAVGRYYLSHTVRSGKVCNSTVFDTIDIRPVITINASNDYFEDFETSHGSWIPERLDTTSNHYTWELGTPDGNTIKTMADGGASAYVTNLKGVYNTLENSAITSPCFVFDKVTRPMINLDIFRDLEGKDDAVVMEYTINDGETWEPLMWEDELGEGINWFNALNLRSQPGNNSNVAWAFQGMGWEDSRHDLDKLVDINGNSNGTIRFRIAFESDELFSPELATEGFGFDNIRIGDRKRRVLVEHFTNTESANAKNSDNLINSILDQADLAKDAIDIQYHSSFNHEDPFYSDYPSGPSSREAYYGINIVPFTFYDGEVIFDYTSEEDEPSNISLKSQALTDPSFKLEINNAESNTGISGNIEVKALENISNKQLQLFIALVEKKITINTGTNELVYENVLRRFLPNPGGTYINSNWDKGSTISYPYSYNYDDYITNKDSLILIAFVQDELSKEILQTISTDKAHLSTSIKPWLGASDELDFILYPNPAREKVYFAFGKESSVNSELHIIDQSGKLVDKIDIPENSSTSFHEISHLKEGIYFVKWINNNEEKIRKLIKTH